MSQTKEITSVLDSMPLKDFNRLVRRFCSQLKRDNNGCLIWLGPKLNGGYGRLYYRSRGTWWAHRVAYELVNGPIPPGLPLDHLCRNPSCVEPSHLEATTQRENIMRGNGICAIHARKTVAKCGHAFTEVIFAKGRSWRRCRPCALARKRAWYASRQITIAEAKSGKRPGG